MASRDFPGIGLKGGYADGEDGWGEEQNNNLRKLSAVVQLSVNGRVAFAGDAADGAVFILTDNPNKNKVVSYDNGEKIYYTPIEGWIAYDRYSHEHLRFDGNDWIEIDWTPEAGLPDAPEDGNLYGRQDGEWVEIVPDEGGGGGGIEEAPVDGKRYERKNAGWVEALAGGGGGGGAGPGAHAYWRMLVQSNNGDSYVGARELAFVDADGLTIPTSGGTVIHNGDDGGGFGGAAAAFDGVTSGSTHWQHGAVAGQYIGYEFPAPVDVRGMKLTSSYFVAQTPKAFNLQYSVDGVTWEDLFAIVDQTAWGDPETRTFMDPALAPAWYDEDAPSDGGIYARQNGAWVGIDVDVPVPAPAAHFLIMVLSSGTAAEKLISVVRFKDDAGNVVTPIAARYNGINNLSKVNGSNPNDFEYHNFPAPFVLQFPDPVILGEIDFWPRTDGYATQRPQIIHVFAGSATGKYVDLGVFRAAAPTDGNDTTKYPFDLLP